MEELITIVLVLIVCVITLAIFGLLLYRVGFRDGVKSVRNKEGVVPDCRKNRTLETANELEKMLESHPEVDPGGILKARFQAASKAYVLGIIDIIEFGRVCQIIKKTIE